MVVDPSNRFLYTSGSGYIQGFRIDPLSGALTQIPEAHVSVGTAELLSLAIDPIGRFLYAGGRSLSIAVVAIDRFSGGLTAVEGSSFTTSSVGTANINPCPGFPPICPPFPPLPVVTEIEPHPNGRFLYALRSDGLLLFYINPFSGALNLVGQVGVARPTFGSTAVDPTGRFLYAVARLSELRGRNHPGAHRSAVGQTHPGQRAAD